MTSSTLKSTLKNNTSDPLDPLQHIVGDPKHITELHFGSRGLTSLHDNFRKFVNLEVLWINNNKLSKIAGLVQEDDALGDSSLMTKTKQTDTGCYRLKRLYAQHNKIETLDTNSIRAMKYLEVLVLHNNRLRDMERVVDQLKHLTFLKHLDLFGNPVADELEYRLYIIHNFKNLEVLDRHVITPEERIAAKKKYSEGSLNNRIVFGKTMVPFDPLPKVPKLSDSVVDLERKVRAIKLEREKAEKQKLEQEEREIMEKQMQRQNAKPPCVIRSSGAWSYDTLNQQRIPLTSLKAQQRPETLLREGEIEVLRKIFSEVDADRSNTIDPAEVPHLLKSIVSLTSTDTFQIMSDLTGPKADKSGTVNNSNNQSPPTSIHFTKDECDEFLRSLDRNANGKIEFDEFLRTLFVWPFFCRLKSDQYFALAQDHLKKGNAKEAMAASQKGEKLRALAESGEEFAAKKREEEERQQAGHGSDFIQLTRVRGKKSHFAL